MPNESFIISLFGELNEAKTKENIDKTLKRLKENLSVDVKANFNILDKNKLDEAGKIYLETLDNLKSQINEKLKVSGDIRIIPDITSETERFKVNITEATQVLETFNFQRRQFTDGTSGFVLMNPVNTQSLVESNNLLQQTATTVNQISNSVNSNQVRTPIDVNQVQTANDKLQEQANIIQSNVASISKANSVTEKSRISVTQEIENINEFIQKYSQFINNIKGKPDIKIDYSRKTGEIIGFTANLKTATGTLDTYRYHLKKVKSMTGGKYNAFVLRNVSSNNNIFSQQVKDLTTLENKLATFKSNNLDKNLFTTDQTTALTNLYKQISDNITTLKNNANQYNQQEITNTRNLITLLENASNQYKKINEQKSKLDSLALSIRKIQDTSLNPKSGSFIANASDLDRITQSVNNINTAIANARATNQNGEIINSTELSNIDNLLKIVQADIGKINAETVRTSNSNSNALESQNVKLQKLFIKLKEYQQLQLNPDSKKFAGQSEEIDKLTIKLEKLLFFTQNFIQRNNQGELISTKSYDYLDIKVQELVSSLKILRAESGKNIERDESLAAITQKINEQTASINIQIEKWKQAGVYVGELEKNITQLKKDLVNATTSQGINSLVSQFKVYKKEAEQSAVATQTAFNDQLLSQQIATQNSVLDTQIEKWKKMGVYTSEFKTKVDQLRGSLNTINQSNGISVWRQQLQQLNQEANQTKLRMQELANNEGLTQKIAILRNQVDAFLMNNPKAAKVFADQFNNLKTAISTAASSGDLKRLNNDFKNLKLQVKLAGAEGLTFGQRMTQAFKKIAQYAGITSFSMYTIRMIRELITNVRELDTSMTYLKRITDETNSGYDKMFSDAVESAKELNKSVTDVIDAITTFSRLGFDINQSQELANLSSIYSNVAMITQDEASTYLVSVINGFKDLTADNAERIVDVINDVGNKFPTSSKDIGEILSRSSSALSEANNTLEQAVALGTTAQSVAQDASKVGNALKTISLRIRSSKAELVDEGLDAEEMVESTAELRKLVMASTGVDILESDLKTFRSTYDIMLDISKVWQNINDLERSALLQKIAGKQNANIAAAILNNSEMLQSVYETSLNSQGAAMREQEKWSESIDASFGRIQATAQSISSNILSSETFKSTLETLNSILETFDKLTASGKGVITVMAGISGAIGASGKGIIAFNKNTVTGTQLVKAYNQSLAISTAEANAFRESISATNRGFYEYTGKLNGAQASVNGYRASVIKATAATVAETVALTALNIVLNAAIGIGIGLIISGITNSMNEAKESFEDATTTIKENLQTLSDYRTSIEDVVNSESDEAEKLKQLGNIKDELSAKYRTEIGDINDVADARERLIDVIDKQNRKELDEYYRNNIDAYEDTLFQFNQVTERNQSEFSVSLSGSLGEDFLKVFDEAKQYLNDYGYTTLNYTIDVDDNIYNYREHLNDVINQIDEIRTKSQDGLTPSEEYIYQDLVEQLEKIDKLLYDKNNTGETFLESTNKMAQRLIMIFPQGTQSVSEWKEQLHEAAGENQYLIDEIDRLVEETVKNIEKITTPTSEINEELQAINKSLLQVKDNISEIGTAISEADDEFEKLEKILSTNNDDDKFFTASEIIETLELYPELESAILKTAYGYKIEKEALENLRQAKLDEQKTALQSQITETHNLLVNTKSRLSAYSQELGGIKTVAQAQLELIEIEKELFNIRNAVNINQKLSMVAENGQELQSKKKALQDFINLTNESKKYDEELHKLQVELNVLGTTFDDVKDSTSAETDALKEQKDALNDLKDDAKQAQEDIQNLLKLTMDMIKKQKNLEKDALKDQLENYKKIISAKKELLDIEKEQYEFQKDLDEKNKDLQEKQIELDALSVEGANYSLEDLKRKAELEKEIADSKSELDEYLFDHEIDLRKDALDKEQDNFENQIEVQTKAIEDYLDHEGLIRADAVALINGKTQQFYNDLYSYTMNYTDKSSYEFNKLWNDAYAAILKYAGGYLDLDLALANLMGQLEAIENKISSIDSATTSAKNSLTGYANQLSTEFEKVDDAIGGTKNNLLNAGQLANDVLTRMTQFQLASNSINSGLMQTAVNVGKFGLLKKYHSGGIVEGENNNSHTEVLAKLMQGELVVTPSQAQNFMNNTLPKLADNSITTNNQNLSPSVIIGDINIQGNADSNTVMQLKKIQDSIVDNVFNAINNQTSRISQTRITGI